MQQQKSASGGLLVIGLIGPGLLALGTWEPQVKTSLDYAYSAYGNAVMVLYGIAFMLLALNLVSDKLSIDIGKRLQVVAVVVLLGCVIYGAQVSKEGMDWFSRQTAFDTPAMKGINHHKYWTSLSEHTGVVETLPGLTLRAAYVLYGPGFQVNGYPVFQNTIDSLTPAAAREIAEHAGVPYRVIPWGIVAYVLSLVAQWIFMMRLGRREQVVENQTLETTQ